MPEMTHPGKSIVEARQVKCVRGGELVLQIEEFSVREGETVAVIGPNGAGKSTLLLAIANLLEPVSGDLFYRGERSNIQNKLVLRRKIALVLQDPLLINASVFDNVALGLRFRHVAKVEVEKRVNYWLQRLGIAHLHQRRARRLSGGEAQRVSLARALVLEPEILLLDEPFSALDALTRATLLEEFQSLIDEVGISAVFVTHDLDEALFLGDRVAVILDGELRQQGLAEEIFNTPLDVEIAALVGVETVIPGSVLAEQDGHVTVNVGDNPVEAVGDMDAGQSLYVCLRPEDITIWRRDEAQASSARNRLMGNIAKMIIQGPLVKIVVDCGFPLTALITRQSAREMKLDVGTAVVATFKASAVHLIAHHN